MPKSTKSVKVESKVEQTQAVPTVSTTKESKKSGKKVVVASTSVAPAMVPVTLATPSVVSNEAEVKANETKSSSKKQKSFVNKKSKNVAEAVPVVESSVSPQQVPPLDGESNEMKFFKELCLVQNEVNAMRKQFGSLSVTLKKLEAAYNSDVKKIKKTKPKRNVPHKLTGFAKPKPVPDKLAKFIGVSAGTELAGPAVTKLVWAQLKEKGLTYEEDKRVFRTNPEISELFNVPKSVNKSTDHKDKAGFNFCNLQKYIANAMR
jgi:hypothetical protein